MRVAVLGATGTVGRHVIEALRDAGVEPVAISRKTGADVTTGAGLAESFAGVQRVVDVTNAPEPEERTATAFFTTAGRHVQQAAHQAGLDRIVVLSIVGIDRFTQGYYVAKQHQERVVREGHVPAWILRSTQFHEFAGQVLGWSRDGDVSYVPDIRVQPIAAAATAGALADLVLATTPAQPFAQVAGPQVERLPDIASRLAAKRGDPPRVEGRRDTSPDAAALENGALLAGEHARIIGMTFQQWLDAEDGTRT